jgi:hypothetical protein
MTKAGIFKTAVIKEVIELTGSSLIDQIKEIPEVAAKGPAVYNQIILAGQLAYADAYKYVYYVSIGKSHPGKTCRKEEHSFQSSIWRH